MSFTVQVGWLIHILQRERDISVLYLTSVGSQTKTFLKDLWQSTDAELDRLADWPAIVDKIKRKEFENKEAFKAYLEEHRRHLDINNSLHGEIPFYTRPMRVFMDWLTDSIKKSEHSGLWKTLIAYQKLIACKVETGVERALGELFFSNRGFASHDDFLWYNKEYNAFRAYFQLAQYYSHLVTPLVSTATDGNGDREVVESIRVFRHLILYQNVSQASVQYGPWWFANMTEYLEVLLKNQRDLADLIFHQINHSMRRTDTNVAFSCVMMTVALVMFPLLLRSVVKYTLNIEKHAVNLAKKMEELNNEKRKTDWLLYRMLPVSVADRLKNQEEVIAEYYKEVTIMFSGVAGFNRIAAELKPLEIVNLLQTLYTLLDSRIELYNVYKVAGLPHYYSKL